MSVNSKKTPMHVIKTVASVAAKFRPAAIAVAGALTLSGCVAPEVVCTESGNCYEVAPPAAEFDGPVFSPFLFGGDTGAIILARTGTKDMVGAVMEAAGLKKEVTKAGREAADTEVPSFASDDRQNFSLRGKSPRHNPILF